MNARAKTWAWRLAKGLLALAILLGVGRQFYHDLTQSAGPGEPDLWALPLRPAWLASSACLYLAALSFSACYWYRLLRLFGARPAFLKAYRAYFIGQLGKYVPGKAWALLMRGGFVAGPDVPLATALITAFYEVLTTMASGALIAAIVFVLAPPDLPTLQWKPLFTGLLLLGLCGVPLLPGVFNFLTRRMARRFAAIDALGLAPIRLTTLIQGLMITGCCWLTFGLSLWALLRGILPEPPALTLGTWARFCGSVGLAYVAGFLAFVLPSGVGVREYFLRQLLGFAGPDKWIAAAVLLLRLVWTSGELLMAAALFPLSRDARRSE